jgi:hypothetical protein
VGPGGVPTSSNFSAVVCPASVKASFARKRQFPELSSRMPARSFPAALVCRGYCCGPPLPDKPVRTDPHVDPTDLKLLLRPERRRACNEEAAMTRHHQPHIDRCFDIDEPTSDTPPRRQSSAQDLRLAICGPARERPAETPKQPDCLTRSEHCPENCKPERRSGTFG